MVDLGKTAGTTLAGVLLGVIAKLIHGRRSTARRIKGIEATLNEMQSDRALTKQDFEHHRAVMTDSIAGLRASVDKLDAKFETAAKKQDEISDAVSYIRGQLEGKKDHAHGRP